MSKPFMVAGDGPDGKLAAEQLATFAHYIRNVQFRFVVTRLPRHNVAAVTHRKSGKRVCDVPHIDVLAAVGDYTVAAKSALQRLIAEKGEQRVYDALSASERGA